MRRRVYNIGCRDGIVMLLPLELYMLHTAAFHPFSNI